MRFAIVLAGILPAAAAHAEDFKCPKPGLVLRYSDGGALRHDGQDGLWCMRSRLNGKPYASAFGHVAFYYRDRARGNEYDKWQTAIPQLWPIAPGKSVSFVWQDVEGGDNAGSQRNSFIFARDVSVEPARQITVPAGTFTVYPIVDLMRGTGGNYHRSVRTYYYAPELGANVKFEYRLISGGQINQPKPWEVVEVIPPK